MSFERQFTIQKAKNDIDCFVIMTAEHHELTLPETISILAEIMNSLCKTLLMKRGEKLNEPK